MNKHLGPYLCVLAIGLGGCNGGFLPFLGLSGSHSQGAEPGNSFAVTVNPAGGINLPTQTATPSPSPHITYGATTFSYQWGSVSTQGVGPGLMWQTPTSSVRTGNTYTQTYASGWGLTITPVEDQSGIHVSMVLTNLTGAPSTLPGLTLGIVGPSVTDGAWANNLSGPGFISAQLPDQSYIGLRVDDPTLIGVINFRNTQAPGNGITELDLYPTGDRYYSYYEYTPQVLASGASQTVNWSVLFGSDPAKMIAPANQAWAKQFPFAFKWSDRRMILRDQMAQYNPDPQSPQGWNIQIDTGNRANWAQFDAWAMSIANGLVANAKKYGAQGAIEWDIEGMNGYAFDGNPSIAETLNPVWDNPDANGNKLIDRFFGAFKAAGLHFGVCLRPWTLKVDASGNISVDSTVSPTQSVMNEIQYANKRWGADMFYVDSVPFQAAPDYRAIWANLSGILVIPEDVMDAFFQFSASLLFDSNSDNINWHAAPRDIYPSAWGVHFQSDLTNPAEVAWITQDIALGSSIMLDGAQDNASLGLAQAIYQNAYPSWDPGGGPNLNALGSPSSVIQLMGFY